VLEKVTLALNAAKYILSFTTLPERVVFHDYPELFLKMDTLDINIKWKKYTNFHL
jgi:hypothetical protein